MKGIAEGVDGLAVFPQLEVQVGARGNAAVACGADFLSRSNGVPTFYGAAVQMGIQGNEVVAVVDHDVVAPATVVDRYNDRTACDCGYGSTCGGIDVNARVEALITVQCNLAIAESRCDVAIVPYGPQEIPCFRECSFAVGLHMGKGSGMLGQTKKRKGQQKHTSKEICSFQAITAFPSLIYYNIREILCKAKPPFG